MFLGMHTLPEDRPIVEVWQMTNRQTKRKTDMAERCLRCGLCQSTLQTGLSFILQQLNYKM